MASEHDPMPDEALADFHRAQAADPTDPRSRYFLAVKQDLGGNHQGAITAWLALLKATPADAPWRGDLVRTIEQVGKINHIAVAGRIAEAGGTEVSPRTMLISTGKKQRIAATARNTDAAKAPGMSWLARQCWASSA